MSSNKPSEFYPNGEKPQIGDLARSAEIGRGTRAIRIWEACSGCGKERWVKRNTSGTLCKSCALRKHSYGPNNPRWNPNRKTVTKSGIRVYVDQNHPYFIMAHKCSHGFAILEHRLIMAQHLGRPLKVGEVVHHIDGDNQNNDIENLLLLSSQAHHQAYTMLQTEINKQEKLIKALQARVTILEAELVQFRVMANTDYGNPDLARGNAPGQE